MWQTDNCPAQSRNVWTDTTATTSTWKPWINEALGAMYNVACFKTSENEKSLTEGWRLSVSGNFSASDNQPISDCTRRWMPHPRSRKPTFVWSANDSMPFSLPHSITCVRDGEIWKRWRFDLFNYSKTSAPVSMPLVLYWCRCLCAFSYIL